MESITINNSPLRRFLPLTSPTPLCFSHRIKEVLNLFIPGEGYSGSDHWHIDVQKR